MGDRVESIDVDGISLETAVVNKWFASALADPKMQGALRTDWLRLAEETLKGADQFIAGILALPIDQRQDLQSAIAKVVGGGAVRLTQPSGKTAGTLVVSSGSERGAAAPDISIGIFHCTFDSFFHHWHCGWGPAKAL